MARRITSPKRKRHLGSRTFGAGNTKNRRGKGSRGGVGRAGLGKHRLFWKIKNEGTKSPKGFVNIMRRTLPILTLDQIARGVQTGHYPQKAGVADVDAKGFKVLGNGPFSVKANVTAHAFSSAAEEKIKAAGGTAVRVQ